MNTLSPGIRQTSTTFLLLLAFTACTHRQIYKNNSGRCQLRLYEDGMYRFQYPLFIGKGKESGSYKMDGNTVLLKRETANTYDSTNYSVYLTGKFDSLLFHFRNLNDSSIAVNFTLNKYPKQFRSDKSGFLKVSYRDLRKMGMVEKGNYIHTIEMTFNNATYTIRDSLINPTQLDIQLNQFAGKKTAILYRRFLCTNDTIVVNGIDRKAIGSDRYLKRK
jgi:hypothetical protein